MNYPFIKMLKFELRTNHIWFGLLFLLVLLFTEVLAILIPGHELKTQFVYTTLFLLYVSQVIHYLNNETKFTLSMQMYLLIPVTQNIKFMSKLCVAFVIFPVLFLLTGSISVSLAYFVTGNPISISNFGITGHVIFICAEIFFLTSSVATLIVMIVKKYASLLFIMTFILLFMGTFGVYLLLGWCSDFESFYELIIIQLQNISGVAVAFLSVIFYGLSYYFFLRRQL